MHEVRLIAENVYILGTMHISNQSAKTVKASIEDLQPKRVLLELDAERYVFLKKNRLGQNLQIPSKQRKTSSSQKSPVNLSPTQEKPPLEIHSEQFLDLFYQFQLHLGNLLKITPGEEMSVAIEIIEALGIEFALIDRPLSHTMQRLQELFSADSKEQKSFKAQVTQLKQELDPQKLQKILGDFQSPATIREIIVQMQSQYPQLTEVLLTERNNYMADQIIKIHLQHPTDKILVIVGAAHMDALIQIIRKKLKP